MTWQRRFNTRDIKTTFASRSFPSKFYFSYLAKRMSKSSISVLQSLTATYTDSEGEDDDRGDRRRRSSSLTSDSNIEIERESTATNTAPSVATPDSNRSGTNTPQSGSSISGNSC